MKLIKRDVVLWLRHLHDAGMPVPRGCAALFRVGGVEIPFEPMRPGPGGRPTHGLRATGANRKIWSAIPLGTAIDIEFVRVLGAGPAAPAHAGTQTRSPSMDKAGSPETASAHVDGLFEPVELPASRIAAFDAYVMVDWSAASAPRTGTDSVWLCICTWRRGCLVVEANENPPTRQACIERLRARLRELIKRGCSVLVAFDFPFGYPGGFARALRLSGVPWRAVWDELRIRIADDQARKTNNRFQVADDLNRQVGAPEGPFWGHPQGRTYPRLHATEPAYPVSGLARLRETDRHARGVQPAWKLWGNGSVGSQALLGIPRLAQLRDDENLRGVSIVWPFETGCVLPPRGQKPRIIFAEIYPSLVRLPDQLNGRVKDSVQVEDIAYHLARHDAAGTLADLFAAPASLEASIVHRVETEEGWILGVTPSPVGTREARRVD